MAVQTGPHPRAQHRSTPQHGSTPRRTKVTSLSDLDVLVKESAKQEEAALQSVSSTRSSTTKESDRTMNTTNQQANQQPGADLADQAARAAAQASQQSASPSGNNESTEEIFERLLAQAREGMANDIKSLITDFDKSVTESLEPVQQAQAKNAEDIASAARDIQSLTRRLDQNDAKFKAMAEGKPLPEETSMLLRTAAVIKDVGAYAGAGLLIGVVGKGVYDFVKREQAEA